MTKGSDHTAPITITPSQQRFADWVTDVLVDIVVLNLFVEFVDAVVIDSFWISILTAILMKLMLDAVLGLERRVSRYFATKEGSAFRVLRFLSVWGILFLSKFVILEAITLVFGEHAQLGHFIEIVLIIVGMLGARALLGVVYARLGEGARGRTER